MLSLKLRNATTIRSVTLYLIRENTDDDDEEDMATTAKDIHIELIDETGDAHRCGIEEMNCLIDSRQLVFGCPDNSTGAISVHIGPKNNGLSVRVFIDEIVLSSRAPYVCESSSAVAGSFDRSQSNIVTPKTKTVEKRLTEINNTLIFERKRVSITRRLICFNVLCRYIYLYVYIYPIICIIVYIKIKLYD